MTKPQEDRSGCAVVISVVLWAIIGYLISSELTSIKQRLDTLEQSIQKAEATQK